MAAERGSAFLLKIGDGSPTPIYTTVAGLKTTQLSINGDAVAITNKGSGGWRQLLSGAGVRSVSVAASGIFTGSAAESQVKGLALAGDLESYELSFESGDRMRGEFLVTGRRSEAGRNPGTFGWTHRGCGSSDGCTANSYSASTARTYRHLKNASPTKAWARA